MKMNGKVTSPSRREGREFNERGGSAANQVVSRQMVDARTDVRAHVTLSSPEARLSRRESEVAFHSAKVASSDTRSRPVRESEERLRLTQFILKRGLNVLLFALMFCAPALAEINVYPKSISLSHQRDFQRIIVQHSDELGVTTDITAEAKISAPESIKTDGTKIYPAFDGEAELTIQVRGEELTIPTAVRNAELDPPISFQREVIPALTKTGCNSGRCHGSARGKDGFQLSLFGYDAPGDHERLTKQISGRRVNLALPDESLLLKKSIGAVTHTGGKRFDKESDYYATIRRWIKEGVTFDELPNADPVSLELFPPKAVLQGPKQNQQFLVIAHYDDGSTRDVTDLSVFLSNNDNSVAISDSGVATSGARGEAFVMARFATITERSQVIVLPQDAPAVDVASYPTNNDIDDLVNEKLAALRIQPSKTCTDEEFVHRLYIDLVGLMPTSEEYRSFIADDDKDKRSKLIDELLDRDEFVDLWTMKWGEMLKIRTANQVSYKALLGFHSWLRERIANNTRWNEIARDVLSASGGTFENPPANYYQIEANPQLIAENVAQVFMGMRIQCAKCHNHPFDRWTMDDYYGFADFFGQIGYKQSRDPREFVVYNKAQGEIAHFVSSRSVDPKYLGGSKPKLDGRDRRALLGEWIASDENPYFARHMANIVWAHHFGRGIIEPVDDVRISNPPSNPELLDELGKRFSGYEYDIKRLIRDICNSLAYQRSTESNPSNRGDVANYAKAKVRRIRAEVLLDSISQITNTQDRFPRLPIGARSVQIADGAVSNYFLSTFGRAPRETVCSCEVEMEPTLSQAFHLLNGDTTNDKIRRGQLIAKWIEKGWTPEQVVDELYVACFSRAATDAEKTHLLSTMKEDGNTKEDLQDIFWALLNSKEFVFNH